MKRRAGITLMEVLVAITITGVGLLALLTLFPLGALEMASSVRDNNSGHIKHNATDIATMLGLRFDTAGPPTPLMTPFSGVQGALYNPAPGTPLLPPANQTFPNGQLMFPNSPSYPVFVDPLGYLRGQGPADQNWVAGLVNTAPRRVSYAGQNIATPVQQLYTWNCFLDEIIFPRSNDIYPFVSLGTPCPPSIPGNPPTFNLVERSMRYSWAFLAQAPQVRVLNEVDLWVVIYSGRPLEAPTIGETAYTAVFNPATGTVSITFAGNPPDVAVGNWIMDVSMTLPPPFVPLTAAAPPAPPRANFHRVVGVTQTSPTTMDLEVSPPPRALGVAYNGIVVLMENVIEVYYRGSY